MMSKMLWYSLCIGQFFSSYFSYFSIVSGWLMMKKKVIFVIFVAPLSRLHHQASTTTRFNILFCCYLFTTGDFKFITLLVLSCQSQRCHIQCCVFQGKGIIQWLWGFVICCALTAKFQVSERERTRSSKISIL